jgi:uncharacterized protein
VVEIHCPTAINTQDQNESRYSFGLFAADQSFIVAQSMGLGYLHKEDNTTKTYSYLVKLNVSAPEVAYSNDAVLDLRNQYQLPAPTGLKVTVNESSVALTLPRGDLESFYTSYNIERLEPTTGLYTRRNINPLIFLSNDAESENMIFSDTLEEVGVDYQYVIIGHSPYDLDGPPSNVVIATRKPAPLGIFPVLHSVSEYDGKLKLYWEFPETNNPDLQAFKIMRSEDAESGFIELATVPTDNRKFLDEYPNPNLNYYKIIAVDQGDHSLESLVQLGQLNDVTAPVTPINLKAIVDKQGLVTLNWDANIETDLKGYRVFYSNVKDADFIQLTNEVLSKTTITHQLAVNVLGKVIYYKILATDLRENDSPVSDPVLLRRPDVTPPSKPLLTKVEPRVEGVRLKWIYSTSDDVQKHELQRKRTTDKNWENIGTFPLGSVDSTHLDSTTRGTLPYIYRMLATDDSNLAASSPMVEVMPIKTNLDTISAFKVVSAVDGIQKQAKLNWKYPNEPELLEFHVYRGTDSSLPHLYTTYKVVKEDIEIEPTDQRAIFVYKDKEIDPTKNYSYQILAKYQDGSSSPLSKKLTFHY